MGKNKDILIKHLFAHLEGIVMIPTLDVLISRISSLDSFKDRSLKKLCTEFGANEGYLHVALHTLCSLSLIKKNEIKNDILFDITDYGKEYIHNFKNFSFYQNLAPQINKIVKTNFSNHSIENYQANINSLSYDIKNIQSSLFGLNNELGERMAFHLEGALLSPLFIYNDYSASDDNLVSINKGIIKSILSLNPKYNIDFLSYFNKRSKSYGVTLSYQPIYSSLDTLIFSDLNKSLLYQRDNKNNEVHVNRKLNVWGSGGAHKTYFKKIDEMVVDIFNQPIESQPLGIADMGCGDGMFLIHLYNLIKEKTLRGKKIDKYPLVIVGADLNNQALESARDNLKLNAIDCNFLISDISNPGKYEKDLNTNFNINIKDLLHVRSFLDHNRIYEDVAIHSESNKIISSCAYAYKGKHISSEMITSNLINHLSKWKVYIKKHGLILLELHGLPLELAQKNKLSTPTAAYESTHGYSDQYIVEYDVFIKCAKIAGMEMVDKYTKLYPDEILTTVSLNLFK